MCGVAIADFIAADGLSYFRDLLLSPLETLEPSQRMSAQLFGYLVKARGGTVVPRPPGQFHELKFEEPRGNHTVADEIGQLKVTLRL